MWVGAGVIRGCEEEGYYFCVIYSIFSVTYSTRPLLMLWYLCCKNSVRLLEELPRSKGWSSEVLQPEFLSVSFQKLMLVHLKSRGVGCPTQQVGCVRNCQLRLTGSVWKKYPFYSLHWGLLTQSAFSPIIPAVLPRLEGRSPARPCLLPHLWSSCALASLAPRTTVSHPPGFSWHLSFPFPFSLIVSLHSCHQC